MRKVSAIIGITVLVLLFAPLPGEGAGLVPCGGCKVDLVEGNNFICPIDQEESTCGVCHIFQTIDNIEDFLLFPSSFNNRTPPIPIIATIFVLIGGFLLLTATGNPQKLEQAKAVLTATIVGLLIIYGAWVFLGAVLSSTGVAKWGDFRSWDFLQVECEAKEIKIDFGTGKNNQ